MESEESLSQEKVCEVLEQFFCAEQNEKQCNISKSIQLEQLYSSSSHGKDFFLYINRWDEEGNGSQF